MDNISETVLTHNSASSWRERNRDRRMILYFVESQFDEYFACVFFSEERGVRAHESDKGRVSTSL